MELGRRLRARRAALGRTVASVATDAALSVPYVANLENGRGNPTVSALDRLAEALGTRLVIALADPGPGAEPGAPAPPRRWWSSRAAAASGARPPCWRRPWERRTPRYARSWRRRWRPWPSRWGATSARATGSACWTPWS
ncbi:helix-turn-helix domain-containing protein [Nonomuraea thailandensis]